jgi:hypothetical protein
MKAGKRSLDVLDLEGLVRRQQQRLQHFFEVECHAGESATSDAAGDAACNLNLIRSGPANLMESDKTVLAFAASTLTRNALARPERVWSLQADFS